MKKLLILLSLLILPGCLTLGRVDPEAQPYLNSFVREANSRGYYPDTSELTIKLVPQKSEKIFYGDKDNALAYCEMPVLGIKAKDYIPAFGQLIEVSEDYWNAVNTVNREATIYHELGHCILHRDHISTTTQSIFGVRPVSIMYPYNFPDLYFYFYKKDYVNELFDNTPSYVKKELRDNKKAP